MSASRAGSTGGRAAGDGSEAGAAAGAAAVVVRQASLADLATVVELRLSLLREHGDSPLYGRLRPDVRPRAERLYASQLTSRSEITFLAEVDGRVVGILRCMLAQGAPLLLPDHYAYISSVYVRPTARRRGVLRALLAAAERWSLEQGVRELRLHNASENDVANAVWAGLGFEAVEVLRIRRLDGAEEAGEAPAARGRGRTSDRRGGAIGRSGPHGD